MAQLSDYFEEVGKPRVTEGNVDEVRVSKMLHILLARLFFGLS